MPCGWRGLARGPIFPDASPKLPIGREVVSDKNNGASGILDLAQRFLPSGGRGILRRIFPTPEAKKDERRSDRGRLRQEARRAAALGYLRCVVGHLEVPAFM